MRMFFPLGERKRETWRGADLKFRSWILSINHIPLDHQINDIDNNLYCQLNIHRNTTGSVTESPGDYHPRMNTLCPYSFETTSVPFAQCYGVLVWLSNFWGILFHKKLWKANGTCTCNLCTLPFCTLGWRIRVRYPWDVTQLTMFSSVLGQCGGHYSPSPLLF